ncbi:MAG: GGDEF domain-containing protein [Treponema sp.]|nr:GGDEF domain-containing protein [Treponema sp.]
MTLTVKNRSALLDMNLHVVPDETTKDFFTYFDFQCDHIVDFVHPDERQRFIDLVTGKDNKDDNRSDVFHLLRNTGEYCYNFVTVRNVRGKFAARIRLFDIYEAIEFARVAAEENSMVRTALGLTGSFLFSYRKSDNILKITHYSQGLETTVYEMKFSDWKEQMISEKLVPESDISMLEVLENEITVFPSNFAVKINSSIRTGGAVTENLRFVGTRHECLHEGNQEVYMIGQILSDESLRQIHHAHNLLDELQLDALTQVYNKKTITAYVEHRFKAKLNDSFALVIVDLDHFKPVNDMYGHLAGDRVLARAAAKIKEVVGGDGVVGRFGGDEFMLLLNGVENVQILRGMLRALLVQIEKEFLGNFEGIDLTCSIGAAVYPANGETYDELFRKADFCLYRAKDKGRNRYVFFRDDLHAQAYADAQAAKNEGKKIEGREIQELKFMATYLQQLSADPHGAIMNIMRHILGTYAADGIIVYAGNDMHRVFSVGIERAELEFADYVLSDNFAKIQRDGFFCFNFPNEIPEDDGEFSIAMQQRKICSALHCMIGDSEKPSGVVVFFRAHTPSQWADYEVNCAKIFAGSLGLLNLEELENM